MLAGVVPDDVDIRPIPVDRRSLKVRKVRPDDVWGIQFGRMKDPRSIAARPNDIREAWRIACLRTHAAINLGFASKRDAEIALKALTDTGVTPWEYVHGGRDKQELQRIMVENLPW